MIINCATFADESLEKKQLLVFSQRKVVVPEVVESLLRLVGERFDECNEDGD